MTLALTRPELVARLITVDIAPVRYAQGYEHFIRSMQAADLAPPRRRADVDAALATAMPEPAMRAFLLQNLETRDGALAWQPNLAVLLRAMPELIGLPGGIGERALCRADVVLARGRGRTMSTQPASRRCGGTSRSCGWPRYPMPAIGRMPSSRRPFRRCSARRWPDRHRAHRRSPPARARRSASRAGGPPCCGHSRRRRRRARGPGGRRRAPRPGRESPA